MVVLDGVRARLHGELAPALRGWDLTTTGNLYARVGDHLEDDLRAALREVMHEDEEEIARVLANYLDCAGGEPMSESEDEVSEECSATQEYLEPKLLAVLATNVEAHELQHVIDRDEVYVPRELKRAMKNRGEDLINAAAAELSSYLAEMGRGAMPRLALIDLAAFKSRYPKSAEGFAGKIAIETMRTEAESTADLLRLPGEELAARAREAYETLYGQPLAETELSPLGR
jgi:hypothetical protein